ncbi:hypothetical protein E8K88_17840 [Lampropedia aestuarii]|uniref:DUF4304 domain-containing protein n=1 Tax=Lampropedia aestuarii TaxID=2562762 RepID=A0A4S5BH04_9BURK|nr:hypothetical protein [Lampropedia aestuarii]THJ30093.1 hypothetical protein E8K88_17840 [Lampropedia aestuarii]
MTKEAKKNFDEALAGILKNGIRATQQIKANKKSLKLKSNEYQETFGEISFDYLSSQKSYYFSIACVSGEFSDFLSKIAPPYQSNRPPDLGHDFSMNTLMEDRGVFSRSNGKINLLDVTNLNEMMLHIESCLNDYYIPKVENFLTFSSSLIEDVAKNPDFYSYPIPLIVFVMKKNSIKFKELQTPMNKKLFKNSLFDKSLLESQF